MRDLENGRTWNTKQKQFINSDARYPAFYGGIRSGKTSAFCRKALRCSLEFPGNRGLMARYTLGEANDTLLVEWQRTIPAPLYVLKRDQWGWIITVHTQGDPSEILIRPLDEAQKYESLELGWVGISQANEQWITRSMWDTLTGRLTWRLPDRSQPRYQAFIEANSGAPWIIDLWGPNADHKEPGYEVVETSLFDNADNLPADFMDAMRRKPEFWKRWFLYPCWEPLSEVSGEPVFKGHFTFELHVAQESVTPDPGWPIVRGWDVPGPIGTVWFQITRKGTLKVLFEQLGEMGASIADVKAQAVSASEVLFPGFTFLDLADPAAWTKSATDQRSPADLFNQTPTPIRLSQGVTSLEGRLEAGKQWLDKLVNGVAAVQIDPRCRLLISALAGGYCWKMIAGRILPEPEKNSASHVVDAWLHALAQVSQHDPSKRRELMGPRGPLIPV